ncbi:hypothetical protein KUL25_11240 [Rhodobacteraceae bacterium N5(2021)]|uniref:Uncharacterized protein n=1 Tax=Gymnodinialimonas phycosphaerae TaxID=2841589 RepID=A0A975TRR1_9RHOB|nr:hypothetical protein [Gymnodinialimonas phycosphaerae]
MFRGLYNVKRLQLGFLRARAVVQSYCNAVDTANSNVDDPNPRQAFRDKTEAKSAVAVQSPDGAGSSVPVTIPVTVDIDDPVQAAAPAHSTERMVKPTHDPGHAARPGYDPDLLGLPVPMRRVTPPSQTPLLSTAGPPRATMSTSRWP